MFNIRHTYARLLVLSLLLLACKEDEPNPLDRMPAATTTGANTWGCLVNGVPWTATGADNMRFDFSVSDFCYVVLSFSQRAFFLGLTDTSGFKVGTYQLKTDSAGAAFANIRHLYKQYDDVLDGQLTVTRLDQRQNIFSGAFEFRVVGLPGDTLRVTNGRFDVGGF